MDKGQYQSKGKVNTLKEDETRSLEWGSNIGEGKRGRIIGERRLLSDKKMRRSATPRAVLRKRPAVRRVRGN